MNMVMYFLFHFGFERFGYVVLWLCMRLEIYYHSVHDRLIIASPVFIKLFHIGSSERN
jgi:hypothetical protein